MPPHYNQEDDKETTTGDEEVRLQLTDNNSTSTPDHWPVIKADDTPTTKLFRSITPSGDGEIQLMQSLTEFTATATPLYFYSINTLLHQQDEECWENTDDSNDEVDTAVISLTELIEDKDITIPQSKKSILNNQKKNCSIPERQRKSVCFPIEEDLITATHTRPRTSDIDIPTLYYTDDEIRHFKDTYNEMKIEKLKEFRRRTKLIFDEIEFDGCEHNWYCIG